MKQFFDKKPRYYNLVLIVIPLIIIFILNNDDITRENYFYIDYGQLS